MKQLSVRSGNRSLTQDSARQHHVKGKTPATAFILLIILLACSVGACNNSNGNSTSKPDPQKLQDSILERVQTDIQNLKADQKRVVDLANDLKSLQKEVRELKIESIKKRLEPLDAKLANGETLTAKQSQEYTGLKARLSSLEMEKSK